MIFTCCHFWRDASASVTSFDIERYKRQRQQEATLVRPRGREVKRTPDKITVVRPATINRELAVLSHLLNKANEWGWIERPAARIRRFQEGHGRITYLTVEQITRLVECAKADSNAAIYPFIVIALETAMRKMEILGMRKENISVDRRVIYIPAVAGETKTGAREQPITKPWLTIFRLPRRIAARHAMVIPVAGRQVRARDGHPRKHSDVSLRLPTSTLTTSYATPLRHTAITHLVQAGVDLPTVKRISGHKTLAMVERYAHQNGAYIDAAMDRTGTVSRSQRQSSPSADPITQELHKARGLTGEAPCKAL
ncbi:MAG: site-specific integrase [Candidatus Accumulibacter sp.]|nr:site-specific integrase [Accumulibacter sp.]